MHIVHDLLNKMVEANASPMLVGGGVRDTYMSGDGLTLDQKHRDVDIEVFGWTLQELVDFLTLHGKVDVVGKSFGVVKFKFDKPSLDFMEIDFSLPRSEEKVAEGHKGFEVQVNPFLSFTEAASRRDFSINSIGFDWRNQKVLDPFGGIEDCHNRILRATSDKFGQDVLRVLRGCQLAGRFDLKVETKTAEVCNKLSSEYQTLSIERISEEWKKLFVMSMVPSKGIQFLKDVGWLKFYPALLDMVGCLQNPVYHGEGDCWVHSLMVMDECAKIAKREQLSDEDKMVLTSSGICHDQGKPGTSTGIYPNIRSSGHPEFGEPIAENFLKSIGMQKWMIERVKPLVRNHMRHLNCQSIKAVCKLACDMEPSNIQELCLLIEADHRGREPSSGLPEKAKLMLELSKQERVSLFKPKRILEGRHLKELGLPPSELYGRLIKECYNLQLNGEIRNLKEAQEWILAQVQMN